MSNLNMVNISMARINITNVNISLMNLTMHVFGLWKKIHTHTQEGTWTHGH